ncbi:helix-turn-helix transcriptional regulator [Nocardiopsis rhodophaea]|uniref:Helix-turn-helix transcriptional regulator n=1 Tax=Nocardiopsis rhodophaea TaxID=280238 RepID=A0ABN2SDY5_9ACTN
MPNFRISEVAALVGVSGDTVRRWVDSGRLAAVRDRNGQRIVDGTALAAFMRDEARAHADTDSGEDPARRLSSARNRFRGLVTDVVLGDVMAQVEIQAGPHRVVSLMSREAAEDLELEVGSVASAIVKSTNVIVESDTSKGTHHA